MLSHTFCIADPDQFESIGVLDRDFIVMHKLFYELHILFNLKLVSSCMTTHVQVGWIYLAPNKNDGHSFSVRCSGSTALKTDIDRRSMEPYR